MPSRVKKKLIRLTFGWSGTKKGGKKRVATTLEDFPFQRFEYEKLAGIRTYTRDEGLASVFFCPDLERLDFLA